MRFLQKVLKNKLPEEELELVRSSFDIIGDIAVIEIPPVIKKREKVIGQTLLSTLKSVNVVCVKQGGHKGKYRRQPMKVIAGPKRLVTIHRESGLRFVLNVESCYFSPRLVTERMRIAKLVKRGERVLVVGSGVAPYPIVIAKHSRAKEVVGVEINPAAHVFALINVCLNKLQERVKVLKGDAGSLPDIGLFDRIIIATPKEGASLLKPVLKFAKPGAKLHVYDFAPEDNLKVAADRLLSVCPQCNVRKVVKSGQHAVRTFRVCVDALLSKHL